jgi:hypothetical protein
MPTRAAMVAAQSGAAEVRAAVRRYRKDLRVIRAIARGGCIEFAGILLV